MGFAPAAPEEAAAAISFLHAFQHQDGLTGNCPRRGGLQWRHRGDQRLGVIMLGLMQHIARWSLFHHKPMLHHRNAIGDFRHHAEIMRDEQHGGALALLQIADQRQDLRLGGDIQGRGRFIGNQHHRIKRQCHRNHGALALPARKLMREGARGFCRMRDTHFLQQCQHAGFNLSIAQAGMDAKHLSDLIANAAQGIERGHGFLEHHGNAGTAQCAHLGLIRAGEVSPLEQDAAVRNAYIARQ